MFNCESGLGLSGHCQISRKPSYCDILRLLIGAPEADGRQPGVHRGGAVYKCSADRPGDCQVIPFDKNGKKNNEIN